MPGAISWKTATAITIANMIGTGVFTSLGFQVVNIHSGFALLMLWVLGGVFALCGALSYAELAAALPRSGGEFHFLGRIYHPALGFLAGWISFTAGFAAPIALSAMAFGRYFSQVATGASPLVLSCAVVILVTLAHVFDLRLGSTFQNLFTVFKVALIVVFIVMALASDAVRSDAAAISFAPQSSDWDFLASGPFAISLLFVMFAYTGWNAATYVIGEMKQPTVDVPRALFVGTLVVIVLYVGLNAVFLYTTPIADLSGQLEVGHVVASRVFGPAGGKLMSTLLSIALVSTISAMVWAGPRVTQVMGEDYPFFGFLARTTRAGIPVQAILLQSGLVLILLLTSSFEIVLVYTQLTLTASSFLTVLGVFYLRAKEPHLERPYKTWGYPVTPFLFVLISLITMGWTLRERPWESLAGLLTLLAGLGIYALLPRRTSNRDAKPHPMP